MAQRIFTVHYNMGPALGANYTYTFKLPCDATLFYVSASNSSANVGTFTIGTSVDADGYLTVQNMGASGAVAEIKTPASWTGALLTSLDSGQYPHILAGTIISITITNVTALVSVDMLLMFTEG